jgi:hypothetical protein
MGGTGWQAGVLLDYFALARLRRVGFLRSAFETPPDNLEGSILYYASSVQARDLGELFVTPALDVPAVLLARAGRPGVFWYEDLASEDPRLALVLHVPARGMAGLLSDARAHAVARGTHKALMGLPGFSDACRTAARHLGLRAGFVALWLARQADLAAAAATCFGRIFDQSGHPKMLLMLNSCFWSTSGLVAAAKRRSIRIIEVHHGVESQSAVTAPGQRPHFSLFDTAPDAVISWELDVRGDSRLLAAGPLGLQLATLISDTRPGDPEPYSKLRGLIAQQRSQLESRLEGRSETGEVLVSLQPADDGQWLCEIVQRLPDVFFWVRRHGSDNSQGPLRLPDPIAGRMESVLATSALLSLLLERIHVHLTRFSAVTLEAAALGIPTVATEDYAADLFMRQVKPNMLSINQGAAMIADQIRTFLTSADERRASRLPNLAEIVPFIDRWAAC